MSSVRRVEIRYRPDSLHDHEKCKDTTTAAVPLINQLLQLLCCGGRRRRMLPVTGWRKER
jgi:hypothetical protein